MPKFDVVSPPNHDVSPVGDTAPDFIRLPVSVELWEDAILSNLTDDGPVLLVFHVMADAFPVTCIWNELRDRGISNEVRTIGVSISLSCRHKSFLVERGVDTRPFSDPTTGVAADYDLERDLDGMVDVTEHRPTAFLLDKKRTIQYRRVAAG